MEISDIRVKLIQDSGDRLKAVCSITLDDEFVVRDLKVVEGTNGLFVAMPSRKLSVHCPQCRGKNHLRARFCNECGAKLPPPRMTGDAAGRMRMHRDIAHPINPTFRELVQNRVIEKYRAESELAKNPDYTPVDIDAGYEEPAEEPAEGYVPSEYDQLIAGLNKGSHESGHEARESREARPQRPPRQQDRRREQERTPRGPRGGGPRPQHGRGEPRRGEHRPSRTQGGGHRPQPLKGNDNEIDEVNGNVRLPGEQPPVFTRRVPSTTYRRTEDTRRIEDPRRMAEPQLDQFDEPTPRREPEVSRVEPPATPRKPEVAPSAVTAPTSTPAPASPPNDETPFGAGL